MRTLEKICVCCASSRQCDPAYADAAGRLGADLARAGMTVVYGGGSFGVMGALADGALAAGGRVVGVIPGFMLENGWGRDGLTERRVVADMPERMRVMMMESDGFVVLPGGSGTLEEMFQALSWKRLGLLTGPIVIVNQADFYRPCLEQLDVSIRQRFMDPRHRNMWTVVETVEEVLPALRSAPPWNPDAIAFAAP